MLNLKKTALAVIALGSTAAFAGTMGPVCSAVNVTVPCENTAWDLGGRALYLQPSVGTHAGERTITTANNTLTRGANPAWGWGFQLEASYHYSTGNDFDLNWYHFRNGNSNTLASPVTINGVLANQLFPIAAPTTSNLVVNAAYQSNDPAWDQVNMEFGQHVDFGENKFARFHAGMNYSRTGNNVFTSMVANSGTSTAFGHSNNISAVFNGFGPRVGMDLTYDWGNGLSVYGDGAFSLLAGSSKTSYYLTEYSPANGNTVVNNWTRYNLSHTKVVPEIDGKLGFMYTYAMAQGDLSFDIGWLWASYIGSMTAYASPTSVNSSFDSNFGVQGLYFGLKWVGNVA